MGRTGTLGVPAGTGALRHAAAGRDHAIRVDGMNDAGSATQPSGNRTEDQRHEGQQGADGHDRGGGVRGLGSDALRLVDCLMVPLLHLRDLLLRLIERDATRRCERLGRLSARLVGAGFVPGYQGANGVRRGGVQGFRIVAARPNLVLDRIQRI